MVNSNAIWKDVLEVGNGANMLKARTIDCEF